MQTPPTLHAMSTKLAQKNLERVTEGRRRVVAMTMKLDDWRKAIRPQPIAILANSIRSSTMTKRQSDLILWCAAADATWEELHASSRWQMPRICGRCVAMSVVDHGDLACTYNLIVRSITDSIARSLAPWVARWIARSTARSLDRSIARSPDRALARSLARSII